LTYFFLPENVVHAEQGLSRADEWVVVVGESVEEGDALALIDDLVVRRGKQTVGQAVSEKIIKFMLQNKPLSNSDGSFTEKLVWKFIHVYRIVSFMNVMHILSSSKVLCDKFEVNRDKVPLCSIYAHFLCAEKLYYGEPLPCSHFFFLQPCCRDRKRLGGKKRLKMEVSPHCVCVLFVAYDWCKPDRTLQRTKGLHEIFFGGCSF
jgi:hypothetical protein